MEGKSSPSRLFAGPAWLAALLAVPVLLGVWWILREPAVPKPASIGVRTVPPPAAQTPAQRQLAPPRAPASAARTAASSVSYASDDVLPDGLRIAPANSGEAHEPGMLPHPITPQHERIYRENSLVGDLNGAMDVKDVQGMRALLKTYRDEYPEDAHLLQDGYAIIADCLERPGAESRASAQRYYDQELASSLRRYIRRHCLEH